MPYPPPDAESLSDKNKMYDTAASELWHLAVYGPVHDGHEFTNMAGAALLDSIGAEFGLDADSEVLEMCSGTGEVCRYLTTHFQCRITGIELNTAQLRHARHKHQQLPSDTAKRIRYVQGDVNTWMPDDAYDLVIAIDSLALLADPADALATAYSALRPGGHLTFADILAGTNLGPRVRAMAWDYDGIRPLPRPADTAELLTHLGFTDVEYTDISPAAVDCFRVISGALTLRKPEIDKVCTPEEYQYWCDSTDFYATSFASGELTYWRFTARRANEEGL